MNRRSFLKHSIIGGGVLVFTPAQIFADKLFYTEDVENIINLTPYGPIEVGNILNFFTKVVNAIRAFKKGYDIFIDEYGRLNEQYYYRGWEPQFNDLYDYRRFSEIAFPTYRYDSSLFSGSNNYTMPVVDYGHGLETRAFVGGPHLVGLGMLAEGMRHRTGSSSQTADRIFPVGQYERGNYTFKDNSYSSVETETGSVKMHYEDHGGGKGGITAQITSWDSDEGKEKKDNVNIDVRYS